MKTTLIPALALAALLLAGGSAFAQNQYGKYSQGTSAYTGGRHGSGAVRYSAGNGSYAAHGNYHGTPNYSSGGGYSHGHGYGSTYGGGGPRSTYAFASHQGWSRGHTYFWHGHHYGWYNNGWFIVDAYPADYPYYYGGYPYYGYSDDYAQGPQGPEDDGDADAGSTSTQVQQSLARMGYYHGSIDGIIGPGTRGAISAYQRDNNLRVTGTINSPLLDALDLD